MTELLRVANTQRHTRPRSEELAAEVTAALAESMEGLGRVAEIVRAMKDHAHPGTGRADIDLDAAAGLVPCYEGELKQVLPNMIVNPAQAIADSQPANGPGMDEKVP